jgi:hypothetical protein
MPVAEKASEVGKDGQHLLAHRIARTGGNVR